MTDASQYDDIFGKFFLTIFLYRKKPLFQRGFLKILSQVIVFFARACYNKVMEKRKIVGIGLSALMVTSLIGGVIYDVSPRYVYAESTEQTESTESDSTDPSVPDEDVTQGPITLTTENSKLFLPGSYEQYLPLNDPTDVAFGAEYIAVAQENRIYLCNRTGDTISYRYFEHERQVSKIQITDENRLFFSDNEAYFFELNVKEADLTAENKQINASTFYIAGDILFAAVGSDLGTNYTMRDLNDLQNYRTVDHNDFRTTPQMTFSNGKLYSVVGRMVSVYEYHSELDRYALSDTVNLFQNVSVTGLKSACAIGTSLYYSVNNDGEEQSLASGVYCYDFAASSSAVLIEEDGYSAMTTYGNRLYAIRNDSVLEFDVKGGALKTTGYEIAASSPSVNRLSEATDTVRAGDILVTADAAAQRVSVYNFRSNEYTVIACDFIPELVATDGDLIAVSSTDFGVYTCRYGEKNFTLGCVRQAQIRGLACVFGNAYFVTSNSVYGAVGNDTTAVHAYNGTPQRMTADLYGNLYISYTDGAVYRFTEQNFIRNGGDGEKLAITLPQNHTSLRADFEGNLYYLSGGSVYKNSDLFTNIDGSDFVYRADGAAQTPVSFAMGFEDTEIYFNFGNYVIKSKEETLSVPTLNRILANNAKTDSFTVHGVEELFVDVPEKTVAVCIDLAKLRTDESEYFPYKDYCRLTESRRGLLLSQTENYFVIILPDEEMGDAYIIHKDPSFLVDTEDYYEQTDHGAYLSSNVFSYFAPSLETALQDVQLLRGASVAVLGYLTAPDREYALIEYQTETKEDGAREIALMKGYVPKSFLTSVSPLPEETEEYLSVYIKANEEGIVFLSEDGEQLIVKERTEAKAVKNEDGTYTVTVEKDGKSYVATSVKESQIDWQKSDSLRIALIVILSVLVLLIIGAYLFLLPRTPKDQPKKKERTERSSANKE